VKGYATDRECADEMANFTIRRMQAKDLRAIWDITWCGWEGVTFRQLIEERYGPLGAKHWRDWKADEVTSQCEKYQEWVLVAQIDGRIVGYATFFYSEEEGLGHVGNNCVDPDFRGRGIGTALNRAVLDCLKARGARIVMVTTMEQDVPAQRVYEKNGFVELARSVTYTLDLGEGERAEGDEQ